MLVITHTYTTEDGRTFPSRNEALIHAAIQASGLYLEEYKKKELIKELDKLLIVIDRSEEFSKEGEALVFPALQDTGIPE
jgi:hypothetical protein